uniref:Uncharacterized protein n=1 Tax=Panagrolaimus sp. ES5 TaxID=591445 RepID=A0AC34GFL3_9BILA
MSDDYQLLKQEIIERSKAKTWKKAKKEWKLDYSYDATEVERCLCGFAGLKECCVIKNTVNQNVAVVGNVCVRKFADFSVYDSYWMSFYDLTPDMRISLNLPAINYCFDKGWINELHFDFLTDTYDKFYHELTQDQQFLRRALNKTVYDRFFEGIAEKE